MVDIEQLIKNWQEWVYDKPLLVDPDELLDWCSLWVGFAIGYSNGKMLPDEAKKIYYDILLPRKLF